MTFALNGGPRLDKGAQSMKNLLPFFFFEGPGEKLLFLLQERQVPALLNLVPVISSLLPFFSNSPEEGLSPFILKPPMSEQPHISLALLLVNEFIRVRFYFDIVFVHVQSTFLYISNMNIRDRRKN